MPLLSIQIKGDDELMARFDAMPNALHDALMIKMTEIGLTFERKVKEEKLLGQVLNQRTGALRSSVFSTTEDLGDHGVQTKVSAGRDVPYAAIHEYGGTTSAHVIEPVKAAALHFFMAGKEVFLKRVNHPGSKIPERSYMRSTLAEMRDEIISDIRQTVRQVSDAT